MIDQPKTVNVPPEPDVQIVALFRDRKTQRVVERETPEHDLFAVGEFYAGLTVPVQGHPLQIRVHLAGAASATDTLWRFDELVKANIQDAVDAAVKRAEDHARRMMLAQGGQMGMPR